MLIKGGRVIDPKSATDEILDIRIEDGLIKDIGKDLEEKDDQVIPAQGLIVGPGLVDIHSHLRQPGQTHKEDIHSASRAAIAGGYTSLVAMANTKPIIDNVQDLEEVLEIMKKENINIYSAVAISQGFEGRQLTDFEALKAAGAVLLTDDGIPLENMDLVYEAMLRAKDLDMVLAFHEEDPFFVKDPGINNGRVGDLLGLQGAKRTSEDILVARDVVLALETGARIDIQHISSKNSIEFIRAGKKLGADIFAEACPHHFSLTEDAVLDHGTLAKMNPPLRTEEDRLAIIEALKDDTIEVIATDHAPHSPEEKAVEFTKAPSGIIGLETALSLAISYLVKPGHLSLMEVLKKMTINPAQKIGIKGGELTIGQRADLVIFDIDKKTQYDKFYSKSSNSPFIGYPLYGQVAYTIAGGKILFERGEFYEQ